MRTLLGCPYSPRVQSQALINICAHVKNPQHWQQYRSLDTRKYYTRWYEWLALHLWLVCLTPVGPPECPAWDNEVLQINGKEEATRKKTCCGIICRQEFLTQFWRHGKLKDYLSRCLCLFLSLSVCLSPSPYCLPPVSISRYLSVSLLGPLSVSLSLSVSVCLCLCLSVYVSLSLSLSDFLSVCLSVSVSLTILVK